jgi:hypothetical protein
MSLMEDGRTILDKSLQYWSVYEVDAPGVEKHVRQELTHLQFSEKGTGKTAGCIGERKEIDPDM